MGAALYAAEPVLLAAIGAGGGAAAGADAGPVRAAGGATRCARPGGGCGTGGGPGPGRRGRPALRGRTGPKRTSPHLTIAAATDRNGTLGIGEDELGWFAAIALAPRDGLSRTEQGSLRLDWLAQLTVPASTVQVVVRAVPLPSAGLDPRTACAHPGPAGRPCGSGRTARSGSRSAWGTRRRRRGQSVGRRRHRGVPDPGRGDKPHQRGAHRPRPRPPGARPGRTARCARRRLRPRLVRRPVGEGLMLPRAVVAAAGQPHRPRVLRRSRLAAGHQRRRLDRAGPGAGGGLGEHSHRGRGGPARTGSRSGCWYGSGPARRRRGQRPAGPGGRSWPRAQSLCSDGKQATGVYVTTPTGAAMAGDEGQEGSHAGLSGENPRAATDSGPGGARSAGRAGGSPARGGAGPGQRRPGRAGAAVRGAAGDGHVHRRLVGGSGARLALPCPRGFGGGGRPVPAVGAPWPLRRTGWASTGSPALTRFAASPATPPRPGRPAPTSRCCVCTRRRPGGGSGGTCPRSRTPS